MLQIVNEILDYNRIISGKFTFQQRSFNIRELLEEVIIVMKPQAEQKKLNMLTEIELHGVDFVMGDAFRLKQILYNLLSNAIKFTQSGEVLLSVFYKRQSDNLHFTFRVKDTGIGLTEEECSRIFNEFEQIDSPEKEVNNKAGAGLGLTIIKALVENQDGRIYVKSEPGEGSTFTVYLTMSIAAEKPDESLAPLALEKSYSNAKVWVVDDDQLILDLCQIILKKKQIDHLCFSSPADLLAASWDPKVKFILMDMRMPEISGAELCRLMKARIPADVKIYAMTAQVLPEELESVLQQGFDGLIMKPFRENDLLSIFSITKLPEDEVTVADLSSITLDTTVVEKMTFGDKELLLKILNRFKDDCEADAIELQQSITDNDQPRARLIVHRIAGRTAQMGSGMLAAEFRTMEMELAEVNDIDTLIRQKLKLLIERLDLLMQLVDQKIG